MKRLIYISLLALLLPAAVYSQSVKDLEKQRNQTLKQLEQTGKMLKETKRNKTATVNKLNLLNQDIKTRKRLINGINNEIYALDKELRKLNLQKDSLGRQLSMEREQYAQTVRQSHYLQMQNSPLLFLLSADDFNQMLRRARYLQEMASYRRHQAAQIKIEQQKIDDQDKQIQQNRKDKQKVLNVQQREKDNLARDERKQKKMLQDLKKKEKELLAQQKRQQKKADDLNKRIDELIKKDIKKDANKLTKEEQLVAGGFEKNKGKLPWPTEKGYISGHFGVQQHPTLAHVTVNNKGVYIQTTAGSVARSVYEGEVSAVFVSDGQNVVIIKHGNYRTVYSNLTTLYVKKGDKLNSKQRIGKIYTDPENDNKTELFFQIRKDTDILNPSLWLAN